jgi:hypothetical protein
MVLPPALTVAGMTFLAAASAEFICVLMVYSSDAFKRLASDIERSAKELERYKSSSSTTSSNKKREAQLERQLAGNTRDYSFMKFKAMLIQASLMLGMLWYMGTVYKGVIVAQLPFESVSFFKMFTARGLNTKDVTACSYVFIYGLSAMAARANLSKLFGTETSPLVAKETTFDAMYHRFSRLGVGK